ncbi:MAG: hypothetical protein LBS11_11625 [Oscillospiraceae bacterium]|nr:hypothetical protein [Oscillospiraceae bacterium]
MATIYDVAEIRRCAARILGVAGDLADDVNREFRTMRDTLFPEFKGKTANAVSEMISLLQSDGNALVSELRSIAGQLSAFAARLEAADREARRQVQSSRG